MLHFALQNNSDLTLYFEVRYKNAMIKAQTLQIRLTDAEKRGFNSAAELAGIPLSSWVRERLRLAAIRDLESAGMRAPFVQPIGETDGKK